MGVAVGHYPSLVDHERIMVMNSKEGRRYFTLGELGHCLSLKLNSIVLSIISVVMVIVNY